MNEIEFPDEELLSLDGFSHYLTSSASSIWLTEKLKIYQDMNQPLAHYWINSSHNTYLTGDQLKSKSSTQAYVNAFKLGCRCVELDCWDGPDGNPIVYHGHTLTSKILFEDIIKVVKQHAFEVSEYPIILSLEVHCTVPQQDRMAEIMTEILGNMVTFFVFSLFFIIYSHKTKFRLLLILCLKALTCFHPQKLLKEELLLKENHCLKMLNQKNMILMKRKTKMRMKVIFFSSFFLLYFFF